MHPVSQLVDNRLFVSRKEVNYMGKLILASNLPRVERPTEVIGVRMQKFCNCSKVKPRIDEKSEIDKAA